MSVFSLTLIAIMLSLDAFVVSISAGICESKKSFKNAFLLALVFGFFQGLMPLIGYFGGREIEHIVRPYDHWIIFGILTFLGGKMIAESLEKDDEDCATKNYFSFKNLVFLGIATSIDALAIGISFSLLEVNIALAVALIAVITFIFCFIGVIAGKKIGKIFGSRAELIGGIVLIGIGIKILIEHLFM